MLTREEGVDAHALRRQGWTISAIARHLGHDRKTIRAYLNGDQVPRQRRQGPDAFVPFLRYCRQRLALRNKQNVCLCCRRRAHHLPPRPAHRADAGDHRLPAPRRRPVHTAALHRALLRWETAVHYHPYWTPQGHCAGGRAEQRLAARAELARHERQETAA